MSLIGETLVAVVGGFAALGTGLMFIRRRLSKDGVEVTKDRAEIDIISLLKSQRDDAIAIATSERDRATLAHEQREAAVAQVIQLSDEIGMLNDRALLMQELIDRLSDTLDATKAKLTEILAMEKAKERPSLTSRIVDSFDSPL